MHDCVLSVTDYEIGVQSFNSMLVKLDLVLDLREALEIDYFVPVLQTGWIILYGKYIGILEKVMIFLLVRFAGFKLYGYFCVQFC